MTRVLLTGGRGFLARHLLPMLQDAAVDSWTLDVAESPGSTQALVGDITDPRSSVEIVTRVRPDVIYHLAGGRGADEASLRRLHVGGTLSLLHAVRDAGLRARVVIVGSAAEYGVVSADRQPIDEAEPCHPMGPYAVTKHEASVAALAFGAREGIDVVVARPFNIVGAGMPHGLLVRDLVSRLQARPLSGRFTLRTGRLDTRRDFIAAQDVGRALMHLAERGRAGEVYNVCSGVATPVRAVVESLVRLAGGVVDVLEDPALQRADDVALSFGRRDKIARDTGFAPSIPLESALRAAWDEAHTGSTR